MEERIRDRRDIPAVGRRYSEPNGRSNQMVQCPFCEEWVLVYLWSFFGSGKRCSCGALLVPWAGIKEEAIE
jgi:hypothetical protein